MDKVMFHTSIRKSSTANKLSLTFPDMEIQAQMIFESLLLMADSHGRIKIIPNMIRQETFGFTRKAIFEVTEDFVIGVIKTLHNLGTIVYYEIEGECYAEFTKWELYQKLPYQKKSLIPDPPETLKDSQKLLEIKINSKNSKEFTENSKPDDMTLHDMKRDDMIMSKTDVPDASCLPDKSETPPERNNGSRRVKANELKVISLEVLEARLCECELDTWERFKFMASQQRKTKSVAESVLIAILEKILKAKADENLCDDAIVYGLNAAIKGEADNANYILKAARGEQLKIGDCGGEVRYGEFNDEDLYPSHARRR